MPVLFFVIPVISAVVGWVINAGAIRFLFRPGLPKKLAGFTVQGLLPKFQPVIARQLGAFAAAEFFSLDAIGEKISDPAAIAKIMPVIEDHIDQFLRHKLAAEMPVISMFIGEKTIDTMKNIFMRELSALFPQVIKSYAENLKNDFPVEKMVSDKIAAFSPGQIETILYRHLSKQFSMIKILGAVTGFLIGLLQVLLTFVLL